MKNSFDIDGNISESIKTRIETLAIVCFHNYLVESKNSKSIKIRIETSKASGFI